jgi:hypothetical protein
MRKFAALLIGCAVLSGCTTLPFRHDLSFAARDVSTADAGALATDAAQMLASIYPPAQTTLVLIPTAAAESEDMPTQAFEQALRAYGFGVVEAPRRADLPAPYGVPVRYRVTQLDGGVLLRLDYQGAAAARFYRRGADGYLLTMAPFAVREAAR